MTPGWPTWLERRDLRLVSVPPRRRMPPYDADALARLTFLDGLDAAPTLRIEGREALDVAGAKPRDEALLERLAAANVPVYGAVAQASADGVALVVVPVGAVRRFAEPLALGVDAVVAQQLSRRLSTELDVAGAVARMTRDLLRPVPGVDNRRAALMSHVPLDDPLTGGLQLHSEHLCLNVRLDDEGRMLVQGVRGPARRDARLEETLQLLEAPIAFTVVDAATHLDEDARLAATAATEHYIGVWRTYQREHLRRELAAVRSFGAVAYGPGRHLGDARWELTLRRPEHAERLTGASDRVTFEVYGKAPAYLTPRLEEDPLEVIASLAAPIASVRIRRDLRDGRVHIEVQPHDGEFPALPESGLLALGLGGERSQLLRRNKAAKRVENHADLRMALGDVEVPIPSRKRRRKLDSLPPAVRRIFGDFEPNGWQRDAIDLAWETGGLIAIQGPPGTGKTTVVAAIRELYAGEAAIGGGDREDASTLLSAFQNTAVDSVMERATVFGLPVKRVRSKTEIARRDGQDEVAAWLRERVEHVDGRLATIDGGPAAEAAREAGWLARDYLAAAQSSAQTAKLLRRLAEQRLRDGTRLLSRGLRNRLERRAGELELEVAAVERRQAGFAARFRRAAVLLRCTPASWADDGPDAAFEALLALETADVLSAGEADALSAAADRGLGEGPPAGLAAIRDRLLDEVSRSRTLTLGVTRDADATELAHAILGALRDRPGGAQAARIQALNRFRDVLAGDRDEVERTLDRYERAVGATTSMSATKPVEGEDGARKYRLVVVDEAARANPLDLIIPLVLGGKTKIVVGDHRQLPQLLEHDIVERVIAGEDDMEALLRQSLFERIYQVLDRSKRAVTLKEQFRMHPDLGKFVSRTFYPPKERFDSLRPADQFVHGLVPYEGVAAVFMEVRGGAERGEVREGTSTRRPYEARAVAAELERLMRQHQGLSFGVITTYAAQVVELWKALQRAGLAQPGERALRPELRSCRDRAGVPILDRAGVPVERLRVGTVDAFQGSEFDVVIVSMVRSNNRPEARARYGHALDPHRLNVAMSRAKRLLILAADPDTLLTGDDLAEPLRAYRRLCETVGKVVVCPL